MPDYDFVTVDVFTDMRFGGNPLAVFPNAVGLSDVQMQNIAREFNLSETCFVLPPADRQHTAQVRIFTPRLELPFAGHPNVGTGTVLAWRGIGAGGDHMVFEELAGLVRVQPFRDQAGKITGAAVSAPQSLQIGVEIETALVAECAGLPESAIITTAHRPLLASVGTGFVLAELADAESLARAMPRAEAFRRIGEEHDLPLKLYLYTRRGGDATRLRTRMFAPLLGVAEDPATGSAAAALAALLTSLAPGAEVDLAFEIEQGVEMGRPSQIIGHAHKSAEGGVHARIAGNCVPVMRGTISL